MSDEKKIIIDEDWKSQVAAEKEAAARRPSADEDAAGTAEANAADGPMLEASFELLVSTFVTEAMVALGQFPHPGSGQIETDPGHAKFAIDMLEVISEKTKGNLDAMEEQGIKDILHQLRMAFIAVTQGAQ
ncbi:MAG: DUF1844 domain-containing protein [Planctomycetaceae bacterium]|uniref:DUF1844 domain-containing protein n=1 Tax=Lacipirellula limnantheis TaxID=2528024 RepID=A0A517TW12_9BACT|nr:DUF1844 domain-containing protein [Lacipirellula limnantheis]MBL9164697.1 DUF1844 domain-containing protein [Planctomycetaceae bacterium]QDT72560.1 hypothetical protein I41_17400 [Lacipirellula limnantheis]